MSHSAQSFDSLDLQIISYLQDDGRKPYREIAESVGVSERTIRLRIANLKESGVLQIVGVVNPVKVGLQEVAIILVDIEHCHLQEVINQLQEMPEVRFIAHVSGEYKLAIQAVSASSAHLKTFLHDKFYKLPYITKSNVMIEFAVFKNDFGYLHHLRESNASDEKVLVASN